MFRPGYSMQPGPTPSVLRGSARRRGSALARVFAFARLHCRTITSSVGKEQKILQTLAPREISPPESQLDLLALIDMNHVVPNLFFVVLNITQCLTLCLCKLVQVGCDHCWMHEAGRVDQWKHPHFRVGHALLLSVGGLG